MGMLSFTKENKEYILKTIEERMKIFDKKQ